MLTPCDSAEWTHGDAGNCSVTLVGDAMHAVVPSFGQGACLAMEDAFALARAVGAVVGKGVGHVPEALRKYEAERLPRTFQAQIASYRQGQNAYGMDGSKYDGDALDFTSEGGVS